MTKASRKFRVTVEKMLHVSGTIEVIANDADAAQQKVDNMMEHPTQPLQTADTRIEWDEPAYEDNTFRTTGDVEEAE